MPRLFSPRLQKARNKVTLRPMSFDYNQYFERRREVCGGELVVKGTRVTVRTLLASLAEGPGTLTETPSRRQGPEKMLVKKK